MKVSSPIIPVGGELPGDTPPRSGQGSTTNGQTGRRKGAGRFAVFNPFCDRTMRDLTGSELRVWMLLWRDCRDGVSRTGQTDIARRAGVNVKTVKRALVALISRGLVKVIERGNLRRGPSTYKVIGWIPP